LLTKIEVGNFLSHASTKLDFGKGVTVFVGHNGAGKSSIIDAITFALFGQHTRNSNRGLIRRGASQAYAKVGFTIGNRYYEAIRKIDSKGSLSAQLFEKKEDELVLRVSGERKQYGESMTREIESLIGLDFEKLKIASIVQQGELNAIIDSDPKKFKELVNAIIGIDKLDIAFSFAKELTENFRLHIRQQLEYDDTDIGLLKLKQDQAKKEITEAEPQKEQLERKKKEYELELKELQQKVDTESPKESMIRDLETRKLELVRYVKTAINSLQKEIQEKERKLSDCQGCFDYVLSKKEIEEQIIIYEEGLSSITDEIRDCSERMGNLSGQEELANRLKLKDGRCPVCDSQVGHLNPLFQEAHIKQEIKKAKGRISFLEKRENEIAGKKREFSEKLQRAIEAESTLLANSIMHPKDLMNLQQEISALKSNILKIPTDLNSSSSLMHLAIDSHSEELLRLISKLQEETKGFDPTQLRNLKDSVEQKRVFLSKIDQELGAISQKIMTAKEQQNKISQALNKLDLVKRYISQLDEIKAQIFNRDGPVATSLRSWALNLMSEKASEYLTAFNVKIQRISLEEKVRDVKIACYSGNTVLDLESLSGGEKVSIALALRLGMAQLLGSSNLNFIVLDEPTTHLDEERRKSLVGVLTQAFEAIGSTSQFLIITHDSEIFENSNVDTIYNFEASSEGTRVTVL